MIRHYLQSGKGTDLRRAVVLADRAGGSRGNAERRLLRAWLVLRISKFAYCNKKNGFDPHHSPLGLAGASSFELFLFVFCPSKRAPDVGPMPR